jgi:hypothetical protein
MVSPPAGRVAGLLASTVKYQPIVSSRSRSGWANPAGVKSTRHCVRSQLPTPPLSVPQRKVMSRAPSASCHSTVPARNEVMTHRAMTCPDGATSEARFPSQTLATSRVATSSSPTNARICGFQTPT